MVLLIEESQMFAPINGSYLIKFGMATSAVPIVP